MNVYNSYRLSFILAATLAIAANGVLVKRAESSTFGPVLSAALSSSGEVKRKMLADIKFDDSRLQRCVKDSGRTYVKDLYALHCNSRRITNTNGIEELKALRILHLNNNAISEIKIAKNKHLKALYLSNNRVTHINTSKNKKLRRLLLNNNRLTKIDVTKNHALEVLRVSDNDIKFMYLGNNPQLEQLSVSGNKLRKLNLKRNTKLAIVKADENRLVDVDVRNSSDLKYLSVNDNKLRQLTVFNSRKLNTLHAIYNPIKQIDLTKNKKLKALSFNRKVSCTGKKCWIAKHERPRLADITFKDSNLAYCLHSEYPDSVYVNQVTTLDCSDQGITSSKGIEGLTALESLNLRKNNLTQIDISKNTLLEELLLLNNQITRLDVSQNRMLKRLVLGGNQLMSLDVTNNTKLSQLSVNANQLTTLDVSNNIALNMLFLLENYFDEIDVTNNAELVDIRLDNNVLCLGDPCPTYIVDSQSGPNGLIAPEMLDVVHGHTAEFFIQPDVGYGISSVSGCDGILAGNIYTTGVINQRCRVYATFERPTLANVDFVDDNLRQCVLSQHADKTYVSEVTSILCNELGIESSEGIEQFPFLESLTLKNNQLTSIDVSYNTSLKTLILSNNQIAEIDLSRNPRLERVVLGNNMLTQLDTQNNVGLRALLINDNDISSLNLSNNIVLMQLFVLRNKLTQLDVTNNKVLMDLRVDESVMCSGSACNR